MSADTPGDPHAGEARERSDRADLAALSDAELQRLAYARGSGDTDSRMRSLAATELASRAPSVRPPAVSTVISGDTARGEDTDVDHDHDGNLDPDLEHDGPPWWRRRSTLLAAAIVAAALFVSGTVQQLSIPRPPPAYAVFDVDETVDDRIYVAALTNRGERLLRDPRVLEAVQVPGVGSPYRLVASVIGPADSELAEQQVCLTVFLGPSPLSRTCGDYPDFLETGVVGGSEQFGLDLAYSWDAEGASRLDVLPTGPSSLEEVLAIGLPAIDDLQDAVPGIPETVAPSARRTATGAPVLGPSVIAEIPGWILLGEVGTIGPEGSELAVCVWATQRDFPSPVVDTRCVRASEFARDGVLVDESGETPVTYGWSPEGDIVFRVAGFIPG